MARMVGKVHVQFQSKDNQLRVVKERTIGQTGALQAREQRPQTKSDRTCPRDMQSIADWLPQQVHVSLAAP